VTTDNTPPANDDAEADELVRRAIVGLAQWVEDAVRNRCITGDAAKLLAQVMQVELRTIQERVLGTPETGKPDPLIRSLTMDELRRMYPKPLERTQ
jgi:hypothetical protein